jgi:hypothetical protein
MGFLIYRLVSRHFSIRTGKSNGEFIGGADIVREMVQSGELQKLLEGAKQQA